ncbi:adenine deaminase [Neobacillus niacini]|uniref:adenine deaminase n=1 Tax=Neobacillus niacini TaxID=86668 RepID=UPI00052F66C6|nr:adenine deaminase [Neobacillus niacini]KGM46151.1 adenine deaminase [Neobacillus niacini]MEC1522238.1 adenine deaminase [Neobacillus niacini]
MKAIISDLIGKAKKIDEVDFVLKNGEIVDVFSLETFKGDVAIFNGYIVGIGHFETSQKVIDVSNQYIIPGLIDGHIHIESTMVRPSEFSRAIIKHGITTVVTDPHEIANVSGIEGIKFMIDDAKNSVVDILVKLPSSVPATKFENNGATLTSNDLRKLLDYDEVIGLAEVMDYPSVINYEQDMMEKIEMVKNKKLVIDGHAAGLSDDKLDIYSIASIRNDHEAVNANEAITRVRKGFNVLVREGSAAKDLLAILPAITTKNSTRFSFCTDDKHLDEMVEEGTINHAIKLAVKNELDPLIAIQMATINNAKCHGIENKGAVAPGYIADLLIVDDLADLSIHKVIKSGKMVDIESQQRKEQAQIPRSIMNSVNTPKITEEMLNIPLKEGQKANIIEILPGKLITRKRVDFADSKDGFFISNPKKDYLKMAVCERHKRTGNVGLGIVHGLKLKCGAIASTVAHDSHNIVVAGTNDKDIILAIEELQKTQGGLVIVNNGQILARVELPVAGLMSDQPYEVTVKKLLDMHEILETIVDHHSQNIFMILSFLCLPVIPELKLTDKGLFDVVSFNHIKVEA